MNQFQIFRYVVQTVDCGREFHQIWCWLFLAVLLEPNRLWYKLKSARWEYILNILSFCKNCFLNDSIVSSWIAKIIYFRILPRTNEFNIALTKACRTSAGKDDGMMKMLDASHRQATLFSALCMVLYSCTIPWDESLQGYGIDAFREDEKKFLISAGAGAAKDSSWCSWWSAFVPGISLVYRTLVN